MSEAKYQADLIKRIKELLPGCLIIKNDPNQTQGIPDLTILYRDRWAFLEVKASEKSKARPNQPYYIQFWSQESFAAFIYPEGEEAVLEELALYMGVTHVNF